MMLMHIPVSPIHWAPSGPADEQYFNGKAQPVHKHAEESPALRTSNDSLKVPDLVPTSALVKNRSRAVVRTETDRSPSATSQICSKSRQFATEFTAASRQIPCRAVEDKREVQT